MVFEFTQDVAPGIYKVELVAEDNATPSLSTSRDIYIEVIQSLAALGSEDSDGDLIPDDQEGYSDPTAMAFQITKMPSAIVTLCKNRH